MDHPTRRLPGPDDEPPPDRPTQRLGPPTPDAEWAPDPCPKCRGGRIWAAAIPEGFAGPVGLERRLGSFLGDRVKRRRTTCAALVCTECGFTEFYAHRPQDLL